MKILKYVAAGLLTYVISIIIPTVAEAYYAEENDNNLRKHMKE